MHVKLCSYIINGNVLGVDTTSYNTTDLNGNDPYILLHGGESVPTGYSDITSIENFQKYGEELVYDWQDYQRGLKLLYLLKGWDNCTDNEKQICIDYYLDPDYGSGVQSTRQVMFLIGKGYSLPDAKVYLLDKWAEYFEKFTENTNARLLRAVKYLVTWMQITEAADLDIKVTELKTQYLTSANLGLGYGDAVKGIMNWMWSNGAYIDNGFAEQGYTLDGITLNDFLTGFENTLIDDIFWPELKVIYNN